MTDSDNISIVLVQTQGAGNIGSVARVMKNFGLKNLLLVDCQTELSDEAFHRACGADDLLLGAQRFESLREALEGFHLTVGTSSRLVEWIPTVYTPRQMASRLVNFAADERTALVFGAERTGLTNSQLELCQWLVTIFVSPDFESMNLAQAVAIMAYEVSQQIGSANVGRPLQKAEQKEIDGFFDHLEQCLNETGFLPQQDPRRIMRTLRKIFDRALLEERDVRIMRGVLRQWSWYAEKLRGKEN